jgi:glycosyltransferase involved in cell wall biosynthesis
MKIAHIVDCMEVGGAEVLVSQTCHLQRELGHDPRVYAVLSLGLLGAQLRGEGFLVQANVGRHFADSARSFYRVFKETRPDVVHLHNPTPTVYAAIAAKMAGVPSIVSTRHSLVAPPHRKLTELKYALAATCCNWVVGICDATVDNLKSLHTIPASKFARVYNGAVPLRPMPREQCPPKNGFTLLYVGRLARVKNLSFLLNAFHAALTVMPALRLWIVGDGSERSALENFAAQLDIAQQVTFWGQQLDVTPFFSAADAFIMSSTSEGLPMSLVQAFSIALPAIVTNVGGMAEAVRLARAGNVVSLTDPQEMVTAIVNMATGDAERMCFSTNAKAAYRAHFTLSAMVESYADLYRDTRHARMEAQ